MSDNRFSSGNPSTGGASNDYFGTPTQPPNPYGGMPQPPPAAPYGAPGQPASPFGGLPGPVPTGPPPFGTPSLGAPGYGQPAAPPASSSKAKPVIIALVVVGLIVGGWFGYRVYEHSRPVALPATLGGLQVSNLPAILTAVDAAQKQMQDQNPGLQVQFKAYGADATRILIAGAARGRTNVDEDIRSFGNDVGTTTQVGESTCATSPASHITVCERSDGDLTVLVASVTRAPAASEASVAALVDEIRSQI